jgi:hypothetical protein
MVGETGGGSSGHGETLYTIALPASA